MHLRGLKVHLTLKKFSLQEVAQSVRTMSNETDVTSSNFPLLLLHEHVKKKILKKFI